MKTLMRIVRDKRGQSLVEYALIISLVSVALIIGLTALGVDISSIFTTIGGTLNPAP